jgi:hypothetical protein
MVEGCIVCNEIVCSAANLWFAAEVVLSAAKLWFVAQLCVLQRICDSQSKGYLSVMKLWFAAEIELPAAN